MTTTDFVDFFARESLSDGDQTASLRHEIHPDGTRILFNYGTPIAFIMSDGVYGVTDEKYSSTTSKHTNRVRDQFDWTGSYTTTAQDILDTYSVSLFGRMGNRATAETMWTVHDPLTRPERWEQNNAEWVALTHSRFHPKY